ncbi:MAG: sulfoxide reductase heme-binding subunit YedZ [Pseudomonadales bacterium]|nr:sulfoxide reductase heme-binding subunit YedZ [Pseudomonadales bacterium]
MIKGLYQFKPSKIIEVSKIGLFLVCLLPLGLLGRDVWLEFQQPGSALGTDPAVQVVHILGNWAIRFLLITLCCASLSRRVRVVRLVRYRRMLGLFAFAYALLHFTAYYLLLAEAQWALVSADFVKRPYITMGMSALFLLIPLSITSTAGWQRRLRKKWKKLHRLVYAIGILAVVHVAWLAKSSYLDASLYAFCLLILLSERIIMKDKGRAKRPGFARMSEK